MLELAVISALLAIIVGFMMWDRRTAAPMKQQDTARTGIAPGVGSTWQVPLIAACVSMAVAAAEFWALLGGSAPLWKSTRHGWKALHGVLGPYTNLLPSVVFGLLLLALGISRYRAYIRSKGLAAPGAA